MSETDPFPDDNIEDSAEFQIPSLEEFGITNEEDTDETAVPDNADDLRNQIDDLRQQQEDTTNKINSWPLPQTLPPVFIVQNGTGNTWREVVPVNGTLTTGATRNFTGDTVSGAALITLASNQTAVVESREPTITRFIAISGGGTGGFFPVLVTHNGDDGGGLPLYDLYALADTGHVNKLNLSGALPPAWSVPRTFPTAAVTAAVTNSVGMAYMSAAGPIALYFVIEAGC